MKRYLIYVLLMFCCFSVYGQLAEEQRKRWTFAFYGDDSSENFQWSIAGNSNGQNPNVLSEVIWTKLKGAGMGLDVDLNIWSHIFFKGSYHKAFIRNGTATDHDYAADDRTQPTYSAFLKSNEGHTSRYSIALAYEIKFHELLAIMPYAGYAKNRQSFSLKNLEEKGDTKLNSRYQTNWSGTVVGLDLEVARLQRINLNAGLSYQQLHYTGLADWNLIDAFKHPLSFKHTAKGFESQVLLRLNFKINSMCAAYLRGEYRYAETGKGIDRLFLADGQERESRFNGAVRKVKGIGAGIIFSIR
ncbi:hypothetical protein SAMN05421820_10244 [Pedobacter steynii]|uniref:Protochlamydia outer membrane protein domain-containing protein n=1 Tax=Pedobacter steynii TaxID=430522 RepID=A0A1G9MKL6_9SPHI|nr:hypothetical protein [Pedobacter steynii]NQX39567.1 hypothetical protein [Pedobacter steynii]SDL74806.1 hypothetical protein SAMN05421820_10244 [Pedobacter steynii]